MSSSAFQQVNGQWIHSIVTLILATFFLYFVLIGGSCTSLLQCHIQKYVTNSLAFKHSLLFLSILIFTFVLNWYSEESMFPQWNHPEDANLTQPNQAQQPHPEQQLLGWVSASIAIYVFIILMNKCEWQYFVVVAIIMCVILILFTFFKMYNYKYANNMTEQHKRSIQRIQQATIVLFAVLCVVVGIGVYVYYCRQLKEHRKEWSWIDFVFAGCASNRRQGVR